MVIVDYRKVLCSLIEDGSLTVEQVKNAVDRCKESIKQGESWEIAKGLLKYLNDGIIANGKRPFRNNESSLAVFEKMIRLDKRAEAECKEMMDWCVSHDFWSTVILSPEKFRKHYDTMMAQRVRDGQVKPKVVEQVGLGYVATFDEEAYERDRRESVARPAHIDLKKALRAK